jgi:hypothetical protein
MQKSSGGNVQDWILFSIRSAPVHMQRTWQELHSGRSKSHIGGELILIADVILESYRERFPEDVGSEYFCCSVDLLHRHFADGSRCNDLAPFQRVLTLELANPDGELRYRAARICHFHRMRREDVVPELRTGWPA